MSSADVDAHGISGAGGHANHASSDCGYVLLVAALLVMVTLAMTAILLSFVANHDDTRVKKTDGGADRTGGGGSDHAKDTDDRDAGCACSEAGVTRCW